MKTQLVRTTILMQPGLLQRLKLYSMQHQKPVSEVIETAVRKTIDQSENDRLEQMYAGLFKLAGTGAKGVTDASTSIDETLYGEHGAWKGDNE